MQNLDPKLDMSCSDSATESHLGRNLDAQMVVQLVLRLVLQMLAIGDAKSRGSSESYNHIQSNRINIWNENK